MAGLYFSGVKFPDSDCMKCVQLDSHRRIYKAQKSPQ